MPNSHGSSQYNLLRKGKKKYANAPHVNMGGFKVRLLTKAEIRDWVRTLRKIEDARLGKLPVRKFVI